MVGYKESKANSYAFGEEIYTLSELRESFEELIFICKTLKTSGIVKVDQR